MALCEIHLTARNNHHLGRMTTATVLLPEGRPGPFPVLYLLHGLSDDHTVWTRRTRLESYMEALPFPLLVVMPDGGRSFYTDHRASPREAYESFLVRDLIPFIDATFQTRAERAGRVIAGLSMGGFGAVKLALKHPDLFAAAASHSGALRPLAEMLDLPASGGASTVPPADDDWTREFRPLFGENAVGGPDDIYALARNVDRALLPALRLDCGRDDFLIEPNRRFHRHLEALGVRHEYAEHPGAHDWEYWDEHIRDSLTFFGRVLGLR